MEFSKGKQNPHWNNLNHARTFWIDKVLLRWGIFYSRLFCRIDHLQNPYKHSKHFIKFGLIIHLLYHILNFLGVEHMH
jgi:hypothetical protein